ncbi:MAG: type IV pilus assembly protein PilM [Pirellulales bacterium]|nr:type IV pilus assembly protein PilM [Pirellulales bacterium]
MAKVSGVWGIDIGDCALKALRCLPDNTTGRVRADAFDYIEYPKILSQPEANREELVAEALRTFLSRNDVGEDQVAINVPGQNGLSRFIKLPPVESKKIPDLVKYEARQQIPFDLDDVVWDFQQMAGGSEAEGFSLETEVGLFAMKRDQTYKQLQPYTEAKIDVDYIQLAPLALYNYVVADQMPRLPDNDSYDPETLLESVLVLSIGTETTDLVITNGFRVWQRSIPVGGSNFTKALSKELRQTFAKAEHLKRNATQAENPKSLFQAMRPVFTDLVTEVQRSLTFFNNIDKKAKIKHGVALGGGAKLPGLVRFLEQNLNIPMERVDEFHTLVGPGIVDAPAFKDHSSSFGICYGLCLQGLQQARLETNLMPAEIVHNRMIEAKKPWAVAAIAVLMVALGISFTGNWYALHVSSPEYGDRKTAESGATNKVTTFNKDKQEFANGKTAFQGIDKVGEIFVQNQFRLMHWPDLLATVAQATKAPQEVVDNAPEEFKDLQGLHIEAIHSEPGTYEAWKQQKETLGRFERTEDYIAGRMPEPPPTQEEIDAAEEASGEPPLSTPSPASPPGGAPSPLGGGPQDGATGTQGYIITIVGYHDHNAPRGAGDTEHSAYAYLAKTLIVNLRQHVGKTGGFEIRDPVIDSDGLQQPVMIANPDYDPYDPAAIDKPENIERIRLFFEVQLFVIPSPVSEEDEGDAVATLTTPGTG